MDDPELTELRRAVGQLQKFVYEAVKAGKVAGLGHESQLIAQVMQEHMHLKHVHNALEFADLREGMQYEVTVGGETVSPLAHLSGHVAVKGQIEQDPLVRAAFEKMVAAGTSAHHAEHILSAMIMEAGRCAAQAIRAGKDPEEAQKVYKRNIQKLIQDSAFRRKLTRQFPADHSAFE
jgi:uncharacterized protein DUF1841